MALAEVLILNAAYQPIGIVNWQRAITLLYSEMSDGTPKAEVVSSYNDRVLHSFKMKMQMPAIIRLTKYVRPKRNVTVFKSLKRKNIYERDAGTCQYCKIKLSYSQSTLDHVHPRSRGGKDTWTNLVLSCVKCNNKKGDKTPDECGMKLNRQPYAPKLFDSLDAAVIDKIKSIKKFANEEWAEWLSGY